jgi:hypothetical protein
MTTPNRKAIIEKAIELFHDERARNNDPSFDITPTEQELSENGFIASAKSMLMRDNYRAMVESKDYMENFSDFQFDLNEAMQTTTFISGSRGIGKSDIAMHIIDKLTDESIICIAFDCSLDWLKRSSISQYITVKPYTDLNVPYQNTIIDMSILTPIEQQRTVEAFCKKLFEHQINNMANKYYLVFEESQIYFPLSALSSKNTQNTMRLLTVGRNFNISLATISQFPALVSKELIKHAGQIYIGYSTELNTLNYWRGILGTHTEKLKQLSNGQFVYYHRNKISLTEIEPYQNAKAKTQIRQTEPIITPIEPLKTTPQTNNTRAIVSLVTGLLWFVAVLAMLNQLR